MLVYLSGGAAQVRGPSRCRVTAIRRTARSLAQDEDLMGGSSLSQTHRKVDLGSRTANPRVLKLQQGAEG